MKTEKLILLCIALFFFQLVACERSKMESESPAPVSARTGTDDNITAARITTEKTKDIQQKEPITFTLVDGKSPNVMWRVTPSQTFIINKGSQSTIYFQAAGNYRVFAIDSMSYDTAYIDVQVDDEVYTPPSGEQVVKDNELLQITPKFYSDSANVLVLSIVTEGSYNCENNELVTSMSQEGSLFKIQFYGVATSAMCEKGENKPKSTLLLVNPPVDQYDGQIEISFNNKIYKGSFKKTGNKYSFDWPYESAVVFTTKSI